MVAERFQENVLNLQPLHHFEQALLKSHEKEVFHGLIAAFKESGYESNGYFRQEVAGRMLLVCFPQPDMELSEILTISASNYNFSVEQFPFYLALTFGRDFFRSIVKDCLERPEFSDKEKKSLETYLYWTRLTEEKIREEVEHNRNAIH